MESSNKAKRKTKKHPLLRVLLGILLVVIVGCGISLYRSKYSLEVDRYQIATEKLTKPVRIVQLSDFHNSVFGNDNQKVLDAIEKEQPDAVFITGDQINCEEKQIDGAIAFLEKLTKIVPVYFAYGNHEKQYEINFAADLKEAFSATGVTVLEKEYRDVEIGGQKLRIGGVFGYCVIGKYLASGEADKEECAFLDRFGNTDSLKLLLCHIPVYWQTGGGLDWWKADVVFAGHAHGGEVILPGVGGLYGPDYGWLPGRLWGMFDSKDGKKHLVLSRGLGTSQIIPRFHNRPEIVTVDFLPEK